MPRVSVIVPNFNREALIGKTLSNLLEQTLPPDEIIVVDDGSTDQSVEVIRKFGSKVRLIQQPNCGPGAARNAGLAAARGDFIQFQDSDDLFSLNKLEAQSRVLHQTNADLVYGPWVKGHIDNGTFEPEDVVLQQAPLPSRLPLYEWILRGLSIIFQTCLIRRTFMDKVGGYRSDLMPSEDSELLFRMGLHGARLAFCSEALTIYRLHKYNQITAEGTGRAQRLMDWARMLILLHNQIDKQRIQLNWMTQLIAMAELWNTRKWMHLLNCNQPELARQLEARYRCYPDAVNWTVKLCERSAGYWRWRKYQTRWRMFYKFGPLSPYQCELIAQLGLKHTNRNL